MKDINKLAKKYALEAMQMAWLAGSNSIENVNSKSRKTASLTPSEGFQKPEEALLSFKVFYRNIINDKVRFRLINLTGLMLHSWLNVQRLKDKDITIIDSIKLFIECYDLYHSASSLKRTYYRIDKFLHKHKNKKGNGKKKSN